VSALVGANPATDPGTRNTTLGDVYDYATKHYDFHRRQLTLPAAHGHLR
jgi:hypothetical protein